MKRWGLILILAFLSVSDLFATTRYVRNGAGGGCSNGSTNYIPASDTCAGGGTATVYTSIANAQSAGTTIAGDTVYIRAGTYNASIAWDTPSGGFGASWGAAITIAGYPGETVTLRPTGASWILGGGPANAQYVVYQDLVLDGVNSSGDGISLGSAHSGNAPNHLRFQTLEIKNCTGNGIIGGGSFMEFLDLIVHDNGDPAYPPGNNGGYLTPDNSIVDGGEWYNNTAGGIRVGDSTSENSDNNIVRNVKAYNNGFGRSSGFGIFLADNNNTAYNNIVYHNNGYGIVSGQLSAKGNSNIRIYNNTVYDTPGGNGIEVQPGALNTIVKNNIIWGNGANIGNAGTGSSFSTNHCQSAFTGCSVVGDPSFISAPTNFHVSAGSTAIDSGSTLTEFSTDLDGNARPQGLAWDMGAYEYISGGGASITVTTPSSTGITVAVGDTLSITWGSVGAGGTVDITLDRGNDTVFEQTIVSGTANDGSYNWTVDGSANANCKIKVKDSGAATNDVSDNVFAITASGGGGLTSRISDNTVGAKIGDVNGTQETFLWSLGATTNYGTDGSIYVGKYAANDHNHGLLKFTGLSQIPSSATVTSVTLGLYIEDFGGSVNQSFAIRRVLRDWNETQATWNSYSTGNAWTTAGGLGAATDRESAILATLSGVAVTPGYYTVTDTGDLKTAIQNIISGSAANYGFHLEDTSDADSEYRSFVSHEGVNGQRPYLELSFTTSTATISVSSPISGDVFLSGQSGHVRWTSSGVTGNVRIDLSRDGGTTWETLVASAAYDSPDALVTFVAPTSSNCKIKVVSLNDTAVFGTSSAFRIGGTRAGFLLTP